MSSDAPVSQKQSGWRRYINRLLAAEISTFARYYDRVIQWMPRADDSGILLDAIDSAQKGVIREGGLFPSLAGEKESRTVVLINGNFNYNYDIQATLMELKPSLARTSRLALVVYNSYFSWLYQLANKLRIRKGDCPTTFLTRTDIENLNKLTGYTTVRARPVVYFPFRLLGIGDVVNRLFMAVPGLRWFSLAYVVILKPNISEDPVSLPSLSCIIPARNERGNIENAMRRMPDLGCRLEVIFVEGHSNDGTWEEILRVKEKYGDRFDIKACRQQGKGKSDAVRLGFAMANAELLTILDADLTMPPELLGRFYTAYCNGLADFVNGSRLVYPMEGSAMRFLNRLGNIFFAKASSMTLETSIGDSLCGTKLLARHDYRRMTAWRKDFGEFDPFGDFELLFPAALLGLGIVDVPIRYRDRTYGQTNINRFQHGAMLFQMVVIGFLRIRMGSGEL